MNPCELYLLTPPTLDPLTFKHLLIEALEAGPIAAVQLRLKDVSDDEIRKAINILQPVVQERDIAFILNDRPDLAKECSCDGAHIDIEDISIELARAQLGDDLQLGISCYDSRDMAMKAGEQGADYITFGFPSSSKDTDVKASIDLISWWSEMMEIPVVATGGITAENCKPLVKAGADFLSVVDAVWNHTEGPAQGVKSILKAIQEASES